MIITREDFTHPVYIDYRPGELLKTFSLIQEGKDKTTLYLQTNYYSYFYNYKFNFLYYLQYAIYLFIFLFIYFFIFLIRQYRTKLRYEKEKKITELQLKSVQNQTDSHFTFNIFNTISSLFYKKDIEKANYVCDKYSKLLRSALMNSDQISVPLSIEIEDVSNYLVLEKFRLEENMDYSINIGDGVDKNIEIPKMLIHTFVENAIKHGIRPLESEGKISIEISRNNNYYKIDIKDNGIGREKAGERSVSSTGKGLKILDQILQLYQNLKKVKISYKIIDLYDNFKNPNGTQVVIKIPVNK